MIVVTTATRVVSDKDLLDEANWPELWRLAEPRLVRNMRDAKLDNLDELFEDEECPFNAKMDVEFILNEQ